jgi:hypothetical protein
MVFSPGIAGLDHNITDVIPRAKPAGQTRGVQLFVKRRFQQLQSWRMNLGKSGLYSQLPYCR